MCGICGIIDYSGSEGMERIRAMADRMAHRGPDDSGIYMSRGSIPQAALGHRRLSIIDLSPLGHQPMSNEDGDIQLVFNGEIYNFKDLRDELERRGHRFRSYTDTETIVHLYEEHGEDCVKHLRGMFAFAIWDDRLKKLVMARDRIGKKPLLYYHGRGRFCFASEFLSLLESGLIDKEISYEAIHYYTSFGYIPAPLTIYKEVFKLPPAHLLTLKDNKIAIKRYWDLGYSKKLDISEEDAQAETLRFLEEAVRIRLHSDVPLGAFLSGGIDSSTVVALMSRVAGSKVKTFSIGFEERDYSELKYARTIAERFKTDHHEFIVRPDALDILPLLVERYGEPYADSSAIPTYYVCRETKRYVTVALNGDGGDEDFAGYERYQGMLASEIYLAMPWPIKGLAKGLVNILPDSVDARNKIRRIKRFFEGAQLPFVERYMCWASISNDDFRSRLYSGQFKDRIYGKEPITLMKSYLNGQRPLTTLDKLLMADTHIYLPDDILVKVDIASMSNSLEARSPFLDHKVMEFAASLPPQYKMKNFIKKYILKKALAGILPRGNIARGKMGFGVPVGAWFRDELKGFLKETLLSPRSLGRGYFRPEAVKDMAAAHLSGKKDYTFQLWALLMLEMWHRRFID